METATRAKKEGEEKMTSENRFVAEIKDIAAVKMVCKECGCAVMFKIAAWKSEQLPTIVRTAGKSGWERVWKRKSASLRFAIHLIGSRSRLRA